MNPKNLTNPFPFRDFIRARETLDRAICTEQEPYLLLTGETGAGKTALLRQLRSSLDRCRYRIVYFTNARRLSAGGLIRVLARILRLPTRRSHSETVQSICRHLKEEPQRLLLWIDDANELPEETLKESRSLSESDLEASFLLQVFLVGMPALREQLQGVPSLWRRIVIREEITGLTREELAAFLSHHFGKDSSCLCEEGQSFLFERARGLPGQIVPMFRTILAAWDGKGPIDPLKAEDILQRWDLA